MACEGLVMASGLAVHEVVSRCCGADASGQCGGHDGVFEESIGDLAGFVSIDLVNCAKRCVFGVLRLMYCRSMAKEEMETITEDRWDADIWGIENAEGQIPKLIFYFGENVSLDAQP